jgi:hypothetical protein
MLIGWDGLQVMAEGRRRCVLEVMRGDATQVTPPPHTRGFTQDRSGGGERGWGATARDQHLENPGRRMGYAPS